MKLISGSHHQKMKCVLSTFHSLGNHLTWTQKVHVTFIDVDETYFWTT